ncbi:P-loop ATPase, Sll1717 family [Cronobacter sakazakii]
MAIVKTFSLKSNPFEHYTAENEPDISLYAIRPRYLSAITERARKLNSFILFGQRGAGKSATRLTVFKEDYSTEEKKPFLVNLTDFTDLLEKFKKGKLTERDIIYLVAYNVIEQMLGWISLLEESERSKVISQLSAKQRELILALLKGFYLSKSEGERDLTTESTLKLLDSAWFTKSQVWTSQKWETISKIIAAAINALSKKTLEDDSIDISKPAEELLKSLTGESANAPRVLITRLVDFSQCFGFSGICVLIDKLDETAVTTNSSEATAQLIFPLLSNIQLLEISNFSWIAFVWDAVQYHFNNKYRIRLDKIAHANISWEHAELREMLDKRMAFYSDGKLKFECILNVTDNKDNVIEQLINISVKSPRELIKLCDIIFREHDANEFKGGINDESLNSGIDKYCLDTIGTWYDNDVLQQIYRLGKVQFVNKHVQSLFKISDQGARIKIKGWEDMQIVKKKGTTPSDAGGKPVTLYEVADPRILRIINKELDPAVGSSDVSEEE